MLQNAKFKSLSTHSRKQSTVLSLPRHTMKCLPVKTDTMEACRESLESIQENCKQSAFGETSVNRIVLLSGESSGKTTCARRALMRRNAKTTTYYFCQAQFDPFPSARPWTALLAALDALCGQALQQPPVHLDRVRAGIVQDLSNDFALLSYLLPTFVILSKGLDKLSSQTTDDLTARTEATNDSKGGLQSLSNRNEFGFTRVKLLMRSLLRCFPTSITLFLDNVEHADESSIALLNAIMEEPGNFPILLVLADSGGSSDRDWRKRFSAGIQKRHIVFTCINLPPLSLDEVDGCLGNLIESWEQKVDIHRIADGNPHLMRLLAEDATEGELLDQNNKNVSIEGIMRKRLTKLSSQKSRDALQIAACWGSFTFSLKSVQPFMPLDSKLSLEESLTLKESPPVLFGQAASSRNLMASNATLLFEEAIKLDFLSAVEGTEDMFTFNHAVAIKVSYNQLPTNLCNLLHLRMGRQTLRKVRFTGQHDDSQVLFRVVDQLNFGSPELAENDRQQIAQLNLRAAQTLIPLSAFDDARNLLTAGVALSGGQRGWKYDFALSWELHSVLCRMQFCLGRHKECKKTAADIISKCVKVGDKIGAYDTLFECCRVEGNTAAACENGREILKDLGQPFPNQIGKGRVLRELLKTKRCLKGKTIKGLITLPLITSPEHKAAIKFLGSIATALFSNRDLEGYMVASLRIIRISVKHGISRESAKSFAAYGILLVKLGASYEKAMKYQKVALGIGNRVDSVGKAQSLMMTSVGLTHLRYPIDIALDHCLLGYELAMGGGEVLTACSCIIMYSSMYLWTGLSLRAFEKDVSSFITTCREYNQHVHALGLRSFRHFSQVFTAEKPVAFDADHDNKWLRSLVSAGAQMLVPIFYSFRTIRAVYFGDFELMEQSMADTRIQVPLLFNSALQARVCYIFWGMAEFMLYKRTGDQSYLRGGNDILKMMKGLLARGDKKCEHMVLLLEAEKLRAKGKPIHLVLQKYKAAAKAALEENFKSHAALANERLGKFLLDIGKGEEDAAFYLQEAAVLYGAWNAQAKVHDIFETHRFLRKRR